MQFETPEQAMRMAEYTREYGIGMGDFEGRVNSELAEAYDYIAAMLDRIAIPEREEQE